MRFGDPLRAKAKREGLRVIYYYWNGGREFWLFTPYGMDEMIDLLPKQRAEMKSA